MYLLVAVVNNDDLLNDIITGWLDIGITAATVLESTDSVQLISETIPIFAGFRSLSSGGMRHNKTIFSAIDDKKLLDLAVEFLKKTCSEIDEPGKGIYFTIPLLDFWKADSKIT